MRRGHLRLGVRCRTFSVAAIAAFCAVTTPANCFAQAPATTPGPSAANHAFQCVLADSLGHPLSGIFLELRAAEPPLEAIRSLTESDGSITFEGLREGEYLLTVAGGILLPPKHVQVTGALSVTLSLRLPITLPATHGHSASTVSVQQLNVSAKVREAAHKASQAWIRNEFRQSRLLVQQALQLRPDYGPALELLGMIDLEERHPAEAVAELLQALRQDPNSARAYLVLASAYNELHQNADALDALSLLAKLSPDVWQLHYEMGRAFQGQGQYHAAMIEFDHAQSASRPENSIIHLGKAHALLGLGDYAGAYQELDIVVRSSPDGPFAAESRELALVIDSHLKKAATIPPGTIARGPNPAKLEH